MQANVTAWREIVNSPVLRNKIAFRADFPQISRSGSADFPRCKPCKIRENENKCDFSLSICKLMGYLLRVT